MHIHQSHRVPRRSPGAPSIPSGLRKLPFPTQSAIKGDILEEAIQTVSNEFLTTSVASSKEEGSGKQRRRQRPLLNALQWFVGSPLSEGKRPPASDHRGVKCARWGSLLAAHCGPNDVWNVLIKFCLFIRLTIGFMGWVLSGLASQCPKGNPPDRVSSLTSRRQISKWRPSIHLNVPLSLMVSNHEVLFKQKNKIN